MVCYGTNDEPMPEMANQSRRRGGQAGNQNACRHGRRTARAIHARKLSRARLKAVAHIGLAIGMFHPDRLPKPRPVRADQLRLLTAYDPELAADLISALTPYPH